MKVNVWGKYQINMEVGVYNLFGMANLNMDWNWHIDTLTVRSLKVHEHFRMKDMSD